MHDVLSDGINKQVLDGFGIVLPTSPLSLKESSITTQHLRLCSAHTAAQHFFPDRCVNVGVCHPRKTRRQPTRLNSLLHLTVCLAALNNLPTQTQYHSRH